MSSIPIIDISDFSSHYDTTSQHIAAKDFADAMRQHGIIGVTGHGMPANCIEQVFKVSRTFFALSNTDKMKAPHPETPTPHRGYLSMGIEKTGQLGAVHSTSEEEKAKLRRQLDWKVSSREQPG